MSPSSNRLFFALLPSPEVRMACDKAGRDIEMKNSSGGRMMSPEDFHLTLLFLGDNVSPEQEAIAVRAARGIRAVPCEFVLDHASCFKEAKVWWLGMHEVPTALTELRNSIQQSTSRAGLPNDHRKFVPHVTVLRGAKVPVPMSKIQPIRWSNSDFVLMRSRLDVTPRTYETLGRWPLLANIGPSTPKVQIALI